MVEINKGDTHLILRACRGRWLNAEYCDYSGAVVLKVKNKKIMADVGWLRLARLAVKYAV